MARSAQKRHTAKKNHAQVSPSSLSALASDFVTVPDQLSDVLPWSIDDQALTCFMTYDISSSIFEKYLPSLYKQDSLIQDALSSAIQAVSFATFALQVRDHKYTSMGRRQYSQALIQTNIALTNPETAVLDRTLAAILLLALFESVVFEGKISLENWTAHTLGVVELLKLRGLRKFESSISQILFAHAGYNIRTSCIRRAVAVPADLVTLNERAMKLFQAVDINTQLSSIIDKTASLKTRLRSTADASNLMYEALEVDQDAANLMETVHPRFRLRVLSNEETVSWAYTNTAHAYPNRCLARFWNIWRIFRMVLNEIVWVGASEATKDLKAQTLPHNLDPLASEIENFARLQDYAEKVIVKTIEDILCSIPMFIDPDSACEGFTPSARSLFWPLSVLQRNHLCPPAAKDYAVAFLDRLGVDLNMPHAARAAKARVDEGEEDW